MLFTNPDDPKRAAAITAVAAAKGRRTVPTAVRGQAGWDRNHPGAANANRLVNTDDSLDQPAANRVVQLRAAIPVASVVDAAVAVAAERAGAAGGVVEILTSNVPHLTALAGHVTASLDVVLLQAHGERPRHLHGPLPACRASLTRRPPRRRFDVLPTGELVPVDIDG